MGGGGAMGGGGGMEGGERPEAPKFVVRWESSAAVREAALKIEDPASGRISEWAGEYYVVSVTGNRMMTGPSGPGGQRGAGSAPPDRAQQMQEMQQRLMQATTLRMKGKEPMPPAKVEMMRGQNGIRTVFLFPRTQAISAEDKEVEFETSMGPMKIKSKFALKDMNYQGQLAL